MYRHFVCDIINYRPVYLVVHKKTISSKTLLQGMYIDNYDMIPVKEIPTAEYELQELLIQAMGCRTGPGETIQLLRYQRMFTRTKDCMFTFCKFKLIQNERKEISFNNHTWLNIYQVT